MTGQVTSYNPTQQVQVKLMQGSVEAYEANLTTVSQGNGKITQTFSFGEVAPGTYDLVFIKKAHLQYKITGVTVGSGDLDLTQNPNKKISLVQMLYGDLRQDGIINLDDANLILNAANYNKIVSAARDTICDLDGSGTINLDDLNIILNAANYNNSASNNCTVSYTAP